ncbi:MAG TPA: hypothetical protein VEL07_02345 [Planctomycetota bacterium]|nr:hypothetical protein [Planctomycetota bacterium]
MRLIVLGLACCAGLASAADGGNRIARFGNHLVISAPAEEPVDRRLAALERGRITVDFVDEPLSEVVAFIGAVAGVNVVCDPGLAARDQTITLQAKDMSLGNVIAWVSRQAGCQVVRLHGALFFTDQPQDLPKTVRLYDISGLTMGTPHFPGPELAMTADGGRSGIVCFFPGDDADEVDSDTRGDEIVDLIKEQVEPGSWRDE